MMGQFHCSHTLEITPVYQASTTSANTPSSRHSGKDKTRLPQLVTHLRVSGSWGLIFIKVIQGRDLCQRMQDFFFLFKQYSTM